MGEVPDWYLLLQAARYLRVPPWDLAAKPMWWIQIALAAQGAESAASKAKRKGSSSADGG